MPTRFEHNIDDLARDLGTVAAEFEPRAAEQVQAVAKDGNAEGKRLARASSGTHARKYPGTFSVQRKGPLSYEWGPRAVGQGMLATILERGSRNNPPHHDLARAADQHGADDLGIRIRVHVLNRLFWP